MADLIASLLFAAAAVALWALTFSRQRGGPEGPVGAHLVTAPLALLVVVALLLTGLAGGFASCGVPRWPVFASLPALFVALVLLPILGTGPGGHLWERLAFVLTLAGVALVLWGPRLFPDSPLSLVGVVLVALVGAVTYTMLLWAWLSWQWRRQAAAQQEDQRQVEYEEEQARWEREQWQAMPAQPELWQLIQFVNARDGGVRGECHAAIAAFADLDARMIQLLGTGWGEHALGYLRDDYPISRQPLAPAMSALLDKLREHWRSTLDTATRPESWFYNLASIIEAGERVAKDGGDVREAMRGWAQLLQGRRGLEPLAKAAAAVASGE